MHYLFITQSGSIVPFFDLYLALRQKGFADRATFIVTDRREFRRFCASRPDFERSPDIAVFKEWELTQKVDERPDFEILKRVEQSSCHAAGLFGAVLADRRLILGPAATLGQDYSRRMSDAALMSILGAGVRAVEQLLDQQKPDVVIGFICVTWLDYLVPLMARTRGIVTLNLRPTKVGNHVIADPYLRDPSPSLREAWQRVKERDIAPSEFARTHVNQVLRGFNKYEGVAKPLEIDRRKVSLRSIARLALHAWRHHRNHDRVDNAVTPPWTEFFEVEIRNKIRRYQTRRLLAGRSVAPGSIPKDRKIVFFPLHYEPEVQLLVYARPFINQIEICRSIAQSLPIDAILLVKEHPRMPGRRTAGWYRKLLDIPRLHMADEAYDSMEYTRRSDVIVTLGGSIGLDAVILGKPVVCLGASQYGLLPGHMVVDTRDLADLGNTLQRALGDYKSDPETIGRYIDMIVGESVSVDWYSKLLRRTDALDYGEEARDQHIERLADYISARVIKFKSNYPDYSVAEW